jgi:alpha-L-arabinofuranosidase
MHEEKTSINLKGVNVGSKAELITLEGEPKERNTYEHPDRITPAKSEHTFVIGTQRIYHFPPNSITIMKFKEN